MSKRMTYEQKYELIQQLISQSDFRRAIFVLYNKNSNLRVRKNIFQFYKVDEIVQCAHHIVTNYHMPEYTFSKMAKHVDDQFTARMLRASVPHWRRAVNAYIRTHDKEKYKSR